MALIEGTITEQWQVEQLRKIRSPSAQYVIPIGSCAVCGGVPAIKNNEQEYPIQNRVYEDTSKITSIRAHSIDQYVPVDGYIKGCPMGERDLAECRDLAAVGQAAGVHPVSRVRRVQAQVQHLRAGGVQLAVHGAGDQRRLRRPVSVP